MSGDTEKTLGHDDTLNVWFIVIALALFVFCTTIFPNIWEFLMATGNYLPSGCYFYGAICNAVLNNPYIYLLMCAFYHSASVTFFKEGMNKIINLGLLAAFALMFLFFGGPFLDSWQ